MARSSRAHLATVAVALWLIAFGYLAGGVAAPPWAQNDVIAGLVLLMLAIVPTRALDPPPAWRPGPGLRDVASR